MLTILFFLLITFSQYLQGASVLKMLKIDTTVSERIVIGILLGMGIQAFIPLLLDYIHVSLNRSSVFGFSIMILAASFFLSGMHKSVLNFSFKCKISKDIWYGLPVILLIAALLVLTFWRAYYLPPYAVDVTSGAEALAEYAIKEGKIVSSVFDVYQNGNSLKPAYLVSLQIIYKLLGVPFGQIWLIVVFFCFLWFLLKTLLSKLNIQISLALVFIFLCIPEMYFYTHSLMYDYPNAVYFTLSVFYFRSFILNRQSKYLIFSSIFAGIAIYIRPETILLYSILLSGGFVFFIKRYTWSQKIKHIFIGLLVPCFVYFISVYVYIHFHLPVKYNISDQVNTDIFQISDIVSKFEGATLDLLFGKYGITNYAYFPYLFIFLFLVEIIIFRKLRSAAKFYLFAIVTVYLFFPLLSHFLPGVSIDYTVKRAYFKLFPLMLLYFADNQFLLFISDKMNRWVSTSTSGT